MPKRIGIDIIRFNNHRIRYKMINLNKSKGSGLFLQRPLFSPKAKRAEVVRQKKYFHSHKKRKDSMKTRAIYIKMLILY